MNIHAGEVPVNQSQSRRGGRGGRGGGVGSFLFILPWRECAIMTLQTSSPRQYLLSVKHSAHISYTDGEMMMRLCL